MSKSTHLTTQNIPTLIKQLAIPASVGMFFNTMYNVVDTFYAGLISTEAIAALSLSFMIFFLIIGLGYGFSSAITALLGNAFGRKKYKLASIYAHKGLFFIPLLGIFLSIIGYYAAPSLFILLYFTKLEIRKIPATKITVGYINLFPIFLNFNFKYF